MEKKTKQKNYKFQAKKMSTQVTSNEKNKIKRRHHESTNS